MNYNSTKGGKRYDHSNINAALYNLAINDSNMNRRGFVNNIGFNFNKPLLMLRLGIATLSILNIPEII